MGRCFICNQSDGHWARDCKIGLATCSSKPGARRIPCRNCNEVPQPGDRIVKMKFGKYANDWLHAKCAAEVAVIAGHMTLATFNEIWN